MPLTDTIYLAALALTAGAACTDARTGHIPNALTLPPLLIAPVLHLIFFGPLGFAISVLAAILCGLVPYLMFRKGAAGGGDVKLLAALGAIAGPGLGLEAQLFGFGIAVVYALCLLTWKGELFRTLSNSMFLLVNPALPRSKRRFPPQTAMTTLRMGVPIFLGTLMAVWVRTSLLGA